MPALEPLSPANTIAVAVTASSVATALPVKIDAQCMVSSPTANATAFIAFGTASTVVVIPTTETNGCPILPGTVQTFTIPPGATHVACIGTVGTTLYFTAGDGQ